MGGGRQDPADRRVHREPARDIIEVMARYLADINGPVAGVPARDRLRLSRWAREGIGMR